MYRSLIRNDRGAGIAEDIQSAPRCRVLRPAYVVARTRLPNRRRAVRRTQRRTLDPQQLQQAVDLRHQRLHLRHIARLLRAPFSTVARALSRLGLGRLRNLEPKPPVQRYEWERPGDLIHVDVKSLARFRKVGHRITGDRQQGRSYGVGYDKVHVAVDDASRLAYVEVLADEQKPTVIGFLSRAVA